MNGIQSMTPGIVGRLSSMGIEPLKQLFARAMSPGGAAMNVPPLAILGAIQNAVKQQQMRQAQMGGVAQMQMPQPTVAQQVVQQADQVERQALPVMAAQGGMMRGYSGGGIVALQNGGAVQKFSKGAEEEGLSVNERFERTIKRLSDAGWFQRPLLDSLAAAMGSQFVAPAPERAPSPESAPTAPAAQAARSEIPRFTAQELERFVRPPAAAPSPAPAPAGQRKAPSTSPAASAASAAPALTPSAGLSPEMEAYFRNRQSDLRTRQGLPEDILAGRAGLEALARESIAAQRGEAEAFGREARERRDAALARSQRRMLDDPQALLALAGSIDTRRGQGIGSLARGAAGFMGQREAAAEAARKEYATAQQTERMLQANVRQATMLEAQRAQALREGDFNRANQIKDQIDALMMQRETLLMERKDKAIEQQRQERLAQATEQQAKAAEVSAGKPTGMVALLRELGLAPTLENVAKLAEVQQGPKSNAAIRKELVEQWSKNLMLQQKFPNFEDFVAAMAPEAGAAAAGAGEFKVLSSRPK